MLKVFGNNIPLLCSQTIPIWIWRFALLTQVNLCEINCQIAHYNFLLSNTCIMWTHNSHMSFLYSRITEFFSPIPVGRSAIPPSPGSTVSLVLDPPSYATRLDLSRCVTFSEYSLLKNVSTLQFSELSHKGLNYKGLSILPKSDYFFVLFLCMPICVFSLAIMCQLSLVFQGDLFRCRICCWP